MCFGSLLFPNPVILRKDCLSAYSEAKRKKERMIKKTFPVSERGNTHKQFEGCNCCSRIKKERQTIRVQSVALRKKNISFGLNKYKHFIHNSY